jgi:hypothetical protein
VITANVTAANVVDAVLTSAPDLNTATDSDDAIQTFASMLLTNIESLQVTNNVPVDDDTTTKAVSSAIDNIMTTYETISNNNPPSSPDQVVARFAAVGSLVQNPSYVSTSTANVSVSIIANSVDAAVSAGIPLTTDMGAPALAALSNALAVGGNGSATSTAASTNVAIAATNAIKKLADAMINSTQLGNAPTVMSTPSATVVLGRSYAGAIKTPVVTQLSGSQSVTFPINGGAAAAGAYDVVGMKAIVVKTNPYGGSVSSNVMTVSISSPTLTVDSSGNIPLARNVEFSIAGDFSAVLPAGKTHGCQYWDITNKVWSTFGCTTTAVYPTYILCSCNHTTDFSGGAVAAAVATNAPGGAPPAVVPGVGTPTPSSVAGTALNVTGLVVGLVVGLVAAAVIVVVIVGAATYVLYKRRRVKTRDEFYNADIQMRLKKEGNWTPDYE